MARDAFVVIGAHDRADGTGGLRIARALCDFLVRQRLPLRDLPDDISDFVCECHRGIISNPERGGEGLLRRRFFLGVGHKFLLLRRG